MFPLRDHSYFDKQYVGEMQKLFPKEEKNVYEPQFNRSPIHYAIANRSTSSTDTSPESFYDHSPVQPLNIRIHPESYESLKLLQSPPRDINGYNRLFMVDQTPTSKRQRPILGRKLLPETMDVKDSELMRQTSTENQNYELFPMRKESSVGNLSISPISNASLFSISPNYVDSARHVPKRFMQEDFVRPGSSFSRVRDSKMCTFCRKNGERPQVYMDHNVKEKVDNKYIVTCPILKSHVCTICNATGEDAHTITYCPVLRHSNNGKPLPSTTITLKNTRVKSNGRKRY